MGDEVTERRSLMKSRKSVGDRTDPCGTPLFIDLKEGRWPSTTAAIERPEKKSERRIDSERRKFGNQSCVPDSIESFRYVQRHSKRFTEMPKSGGPRVREKGKEITSRAFRDGAIPKFLPIPIPIPKNYPIPIPIQYRKICRYYYRYRYFTLIQKICRYRY